MLNLYKISVDDNNRCNTLVLNESKVVTLYKKHGDNYNYIATIAQTHFEKFIADKLKINRAKIMCSVIVHVVFFS